MITLEQVAATERESGGVNGRLVSVEVIDDPSEGLILLALYNEPSLLIARSIDRLGVEFQLGKWSADHAEH